MFAGAKVNKSWVKPDASFVKVNWHASLDVKKRLMGMEIIIRDEEGKALLAVCGYRNMVQKPDIAECYALRKALEICRDLNFQKVIFEGDAKAIIMAVQSDEENISCHGPLINDIRHVLRNRCEWSIQFAY